MSHSSDNKRIYTNTISGTKYGVSIADVKAVLGVKTKNDIGSIITYAANENKINQWAKYKDVRSDLLRKLTEADFQDVYFGLKVPIYASGFITVLAAFIYAYNNTGWVHLHPRGKATYNEWFRVHDFASTTENHGYNADANCFVYPNGSTLPTEYIYGQSNQAGCTWTLGLNTGNNLNTDSIGIGDLKLGGSEGTAFSNLYFGLLFEKPGSPNTYKIVTNTTVLSGTDGNSVTLTELNNDGLSGLETGVTYTVYPILCDHSHSTPGSISNTDLVVGLPTESFTFHQITEAASLVLLINTASAKWSEPAKLTVSAKVGMHHTGGGAPSIQTVHYYLYPADYSGDDSYTTTLTGNGSSGTIGPISETTTAQIYYQGRPTRPNWVRIYAYAEGHTGVEKTLYVKVREGGFPDPDPPVE